MRDNMGLYRGKRKDTGEWVEGALYAFYNFERVVTQILGDRTNGVPDAYEVDPDTMGQFTGMTDIGGKRIFEGDIMKTAVAGLTPHTGVVEFAEGAFGLRCTDGAAFFLCFVAGSCTVISNIHDTPELLEVSK